VTVEVTGELTEEGWVVDKGDITSIISEWDHKFLLEKEDPLIDAFEQTDEKESVVELDHPPTAEVMAAVLERKMIEQFPETVSDVVVEVRETAELCATK
jgi:6-pyruvoyltetrahydropterin/6-carboxytetrahydropterin synthase